MLRKSRTAPRRAYVQCDKGKLPRCAPFKAPLRLKCLANLQQPRRSLDFSSLRPRRLFRLREFFLSFFPSAEGCLAVGRLATASAIHSHFATNRPSHRKRRVRAALMGLFKATRRLRSSLQIPILGWPLLRAPHSYNSQQPVGRTPNSRLLTTECQAFTVQG